MSLSLHATRGICPLFALMLGSCSLLFTETSSTDAGVASDASSADPDAAASPDAADHDAGPASIVRCEPVGNLAMHFDWEEPNPLQDKASPAQPVMHSGMTTGPSASWPCGDVASFEENAFVRRAHTPELGEEAGSIEMWFLPGTTDGVSSLPIFSKTEGAVDAVAEFIVHQAPVGVDSSEFRVIFQVESDNTNKYFCSEVLQYGCWHNLVLNFGQSPLEMYVNGTSKVSGAMTLNGDPIQCEALGPDGNGNAANLTDFRFGTDGLGNFFTGGKLDEIRALAAHLSVPTYLPEEGICPP